MRQRLNELTLDELREENKLLRETIRGTHCPVCDQYCKLYRRNMYAKQAKILINLHQHTLRQSRLEHYGLVSAKQWSFFHIREFTKATDGEFSKLANWDLILPGPMRGLWRITSLGKDFVLNKEKVEKYIWLYNNNRVGYHPDKTNPLVSITDVLSSKFNYDELMSH